MGCAGSEVGGGRSGSRGVTIRMESRLWTGDFAGYWLGDDWLSGVDGWGVWVVEAGETVGDDLGG